MKKLADCVDQARTMGAAFVVTAAGRVPIAEWAESMGPDGIWWSFEYVFPKHAIICDQGGPFRSVFRLLDAAGDPV